MGQVNKTSPPPLGGAPLLTIFNSKPSSTTKNLFKIGMDEHLRISMEGSIWSFVTPLKVRCSGVLQKGPRASRGSKK